MAIYKAAKEREKSEQNGTPVHEDDARDRQSLASLSEISGAHESAESAPTEESHKVEIQAGGELAELSGKTTGSDGTASDESERNRAVVEELVDDRSGAADAESNEVQHPQSLSDNGKSAAESDDDGQDVQKPSLEYHVEQTVRPLRSVYAHHRLRPQTQRIPYIGSFTAVFVILMMFSATAFAAYAGKVPPHVEEVEISETVNSDNTVPMIVKVAGSWMAGRDGLWCILGDKDVPPAIDDKGWVMAENGLCKFNVSGGSFEIYVKDSRGNISTSTEEDKIDINRVVTVKLSFDKLYMPLEGVHELKAQVIAIGDVDSTVHWSSSDEKIATVKDGVITGVGVGRATITARTQDGTKAETEAVITDLITLPNWNTFSKPMLRADVFTDEEAALLDEILFDRVARGGGDGTRGGAVAAARFLTLEFPYRVPYFFENGRINALSGRPQCDGEGRYYHKGLYLSETKYDILQQDLIRFGPATWGEPLSNWETKYAFVAGQQYPNGLDCSGFVCWVLINGGTDVGDIGAGDEYGKNDLCDLAPLEWLSDAYLKSDKPQVGDLIAQDGHMAIIIGMTDTEIWIAESLFTSVRVTHFTRGQAVINSGIYDYVVPMDATYKADGNVTEMWTELGWVDKESNEE